MKIGIFGGTFDPFHIGHKAIVDKVLDEGLVDRVVIYPSIVDYYRKDKSRCLPYPSRLEIIQEFFPVSRYVDKVIIYTHDYEILKGMTQSMVSEYITSRRYINMLIDAKLSFGLNNKYYTIIGGDSFNKFNTWYRYEELATLTDLIVIKRDQDLVDYKGSLNCDVKVLEINKDYAEISSSKIREIYKSDINLYKENMMSLSTVLNPMNRELLLSTPIFKVFNETVSTKSGEFKPIKVDAPDWVSIIVEDSSSFLMTKQLRYGLNKEVTEFPCGTVEFGETPVECASRELQEETGYYINPKDLTYLGTCATNPGFMMNHMHFYYADLTKVIFNKTKTNFDEHEDITTQWMKKEDVFTEVKLNKDAPAFMSVALLNYNTFKIPETIARIFND